MAMTSAKAAWTVAAMLGMSLAGWSQAVPMRVEAAAPVAGNASGAAQVKDDLFDGTEKFAAGAKDVTEVNLDPSMLGMVGGKGGAGELARKMDFMIIHTYSYERAGMYRDEDVEVFRRKLADGSWHCSIHVRSKDGTTDICNRTAKDGETNEMVILSAEPKELTFIHMRGRMSLSDLEKMNGQQSSGLQKRK